MMVPPGTPGSLLAESGGGAITVTWAPVASQGVRQYVVYVSPSDPDPFTSHSQVVTVTGASATTYIDVTATAGDLRYYMVTADNSGGTVPGGESEPQASAVSQLSPPGVPANLAVVFTGTGHDEAQVSWLSPGGTVTGYNLLRNGIPLTTVTAASFLDTGTAGQFGVTFTYAVEAVNTGGGIGGVGPRTSTVTAVVPPSAPTGVGALPIGGAITLGWNSAPVTQNVLRYYVYADSSNADPYSLGLPARAQTVLSPGTGWSETATAGTLRYYRVTALGTQGGESGPSSAVSQKFAPDPPTGLAVTYTGANRDEAALTWTPPVGQTVERYHVYRNGAPLTTVTSASVTDTTTAGQYGVNFTYRIQSDNLSGGIGGAGNTSTAVSRSVPPAPAVLVSAGLSTTSDTAVTLQWNPIAGQGVVGYTVYRQVDGGVLYQAVTVTAANTSVTVLGCGMRGHTYGFQVHAVNSGGEGAASNTRTVIIPPSIPVGLSAVSGFPGASTRVDLSWTANPLSEGVTGYRLYRSGAVSPLGGYAVVTTLDQATLTHSDTGLSDAVTYYYLATAIGAGLESGLNTVNARAIVSYRPPAAPTGPSASPGNASITVTWSSTGVATTYPVAGYYVYRSTVSGVLGTRVTPGSTPYAGLSFIDSGLTNGTAYYYQVKAVDDHGNVGAASSEVGEMPVVRPGQVSIQSAFGSGNQEIQLAWTASVPGTLPLGSYRIQRTDVSTTAVTIYTIPASVPAFSDNNGGAGLPNTTNFEYIVWAVDSTGLFSVPAHISLPSSPVTASSGAVTVNPPQDPQATGGTGSVTLTWVAAYDPPGGSSIANYELYRGAGSPSTTAPLTTLGSSAVSLVDTGLTNGTRYYYYLVSLDDSLTPNASSRSATVSAVPANPPGIPTPSVTDGDSQATVSWTIPAPIDNVPVTAIQLNRVPALGSPVTVLVPATSYVDTGLTNGTTYIYRVTALNQNRLAGSPSTPVTAYPYRLGPPLNAGIGVLVSPSVIRVSFDPPSAPSFPVTGYALYRSDSPGGPYKEMPPPRAGVVSYITDLSAPESHPFYYTVSAIDDKGHIGAMSAEVFEQVTTPPQAPSTLRVMGGDGQILVDWPDSVPGTLPVSFYVVFRDGSAAATLSGDDSWFLDVPTANGASHSYEVVAYDPFGRPDPDAHQSPPSATASAASGNNNVNAPTALTATATGEASIHLAWTPPNDMGRPVTVYNIWRSGTSMPSVYVLAASVTCALGTPVTVFDDADLSPGAPYYYVVTAYDSTALRESSYSNEAHADTLPRSRAVPSIGAAGQMALDHNLVKPLEGQKLGIFFKLSVAADVEIHIYNVAGDLMSEIHYGPAPADQMLNVDWDVKDRLGSMMSSGIYLVEITAGPLHQIKKVAVLR